MAHVNLEVTVGTLELSNPLVIVSGVFGYGDEFAALHGFNPEDAGAVILKGVSRQPWPGNPPPRIVETTAGMLNSIGLQNIGVERLVNEKLPLWENINTKVIVNVVGHSTLEYVEVSQIASSSPRVDGLELNLSCPNIAQGGLAFGTDPEQVKAITARVRDKVPDLPIWVKLTPNVEQIGPLALAAAQGGASAISLINTLRGMAIDCKTRRPILSRNIGGLSGPAIKPVALLKVAEVARTFKQNHIPIPIIGLGGVMNARDVLEFMIAGATAVGIGTALFYDPYSVQRLRSELTQLIDRLGQDSGIADDFQIASYIGTLQWNI
ncbi:dihydroorotate dehydrogenase [bacterium]|nr:dihydroorotate dehydrogenase [bacterium]